MLRIVCRISKLLIFVISNTMIFLLLWFGLKNIFCFNFFLIFFMYFSNINTFDSLFLEENFSKLSYWNCHEKTRLSNLMHFQDEMVLFIFPLKEEKMFTDKEQSSRMTSWKLFFCCRAVINLLPANVPILGSFLAGKQHVKWKRQE